MRHGQANWQRQTVCLEAEGMKCSKDAFFSFFFIFSSLHGGKSEYEVSNQDTVTQAQRSGA
jgi:hypothetical protein